MLSVILGGMIRFQKKYDQPYDQDSDKSFAEIISVEWHNIMENLLW